MRRRHGDRQCDPRYKRYCHATRRSGEEGIHRLGARMQPRTPSSRHRSILRCRPDGPWLLVHRKGSARSVHDLSSRAKQGWTLHSKRLVHRRELGPLGSSEEPSHRLTSHRIGLARLHWLNYTFVVIQDVWGLFCTNRFDWKVPDQRATLHEWRALQPPQAWQWLLSVPIEF